jgi:glycosyltransferase involved in cell wall biosynthesis
MVRVAVLFEYPTLYGGERSMLAAIEAIDRTVVEVVAIGPEEGLLADALRHRQIEHVGLQVFDKHMQRLPRDQIVPALAERVKSVKPDVLHANSLSMSVLTGLLELPVPRVGHLRDIISLSKNAIRLLNNNDLLIAVSRATRDYHVGHGLEPHKVRVIYNGIDGNAFRSDDQNNELRDELGLPDDAIVALTVGQIGLRKGLDVVLDAFLAITKKVPGLHFVMVGERSSSKAETIEYEAGLKNTAIEAGLENRVHWLGYRQDVPNLMANATMLVHAAHQEPLGRVLLEATVAGLPIVATDVGGTSEIVQNNVSGRLVPKGDANELAIGISELATNKQLQRQFADAAKIRAEQVFDVQRSAEALLDTWRLFEA